jgi:hypothetical protein
LGAALGTTEGWQDGARVTFVWVGGADGAVVAGITEGCSVAFELSDGLLPVEGDSLGETEGSSDLDWVGSNVGAMLGKSVELLILIDGC